MLLYLLPEGSILNKFCAVSKWSVMILFLWKDPLPITLCSPFFSATLQLASDSIWQYTLNCQPSSSSILYSSWKPSRSGGATEPSLAQMLRSPGKILRGVSTQEFNRDPLHINWDCVERWAQLCASWSPWPLTLFCWCSD